MIKNAFSKAYYRVLVTALALTPALTMAQGPTPSPGSLRNPLAFDNLTDFLAAILRVLITLAIPIIVFFIIYAGFQYVTARGNAAQVEQATRALTYAIIGGVIVIGALVIGEIIGNLVGSFRAAS